MLVIVLRGESLQGVSLAPLLVFVFIGDLQRCTFTKKKKGQVKSQIW